MISVVIPTYNRKELLKRALDSVLEQTYRDYEIIIIDDCSSDGTAAYIEETYNDMIASARMKIVSNSANRDKSYNRNYGVSIASGELIAFLDDDDMWLPVHLSTLFSVFEEDDRIEMVFSNAYIEYPSGRKETAVKNIPSGSGRIQIEAFLTGQIAFSQCCLIKKETFERLGGYDEKMTVYEDRLFFSKVALECSVHYVDVPTARILPGPHSYSFRQSLAKKAQDKVYVNKRIAGMMREHAYCNAGRIRAAMYYNLSVQFSYFDNKRALYYLMQVVLNDPFFSVSLSFWRQLIFIIRRKGLRSRQFEEIFNVS